MAALHDDLPGRSFGLEILARQVLPTVLRTALDMAAVSFVLAHNHPSGDPTPTREDEAMTQELRHLSAELHVPLTAHVIVTPSGRYAAVHE